MKDCSLSPDDSSTDVQKLLESEVCAILPQLNVAGGRRVVGNVVINGADAEVDVVYETDEERIYAEIYCRLGTLASSQRNKMLADAAKLTLINDRGGKLRIHKMIVLAGDGSRKSAFGENSWRQQFLLCHNIEFVSFTLSEDQQARLREAIARQQRGNAMRKKQNKHLPTAASQSHCD